MTHVETLREQYDQMLAYAAHLKAQAGEEMKRRHREEEESLAQLCREWNTKDRRTIMDMMK